MAEDLSKTALFILGIIANEPTNPYAMCKLVNYNRRNLRNKVPAQTIFSIIKILNKKGLIAGKRIKNGNMPDMTVYSITTKGEKTLKQNLMTCISFPEDPLTNLVLSLMLMCYLDKEEALKALDEYRKKIKMNIAARKKILDGIEDKGLFTRIISANHILNMQKVNLKTVNELINSLQANPQCKNLPIPWWRDDFLQDEKRRKNAGTDELLENYAEEAPALAASSRRASGRKTPKKSEKA
jgi:DNA-binding PadR family transcriptional regulator